MAPTPAVQNFTESLQTLPPGASLDHALQLALDDETELRKLFATDKRNTRLVDPHVGLIDVFDAPNAIRTTRARVVQGSEDLSAHYVMPLTEANRRKEGAPCMVKNLEEFKKNWGVFTEGSLSHLIDWNNVIAAGGSVLACLLPLDDAAKVSKRSIRKHYHSKAYPTSDIDLFLWGMTPEQAELKIKVIYEAVRDSIPWDVTCIRTKHTVSIHSQYPYRAIQIVLRLYQSPAEILAGFDIDAPCCAYDGDRVWANPRAIAAMIRQCNTVDMSRRSPSYEVRLLKYSSRGFEVYVPNLKREDIDPTIYERSIAKMEGLARLLVLEKLTNTDIRYAFLESRRTLRGRPNPLGRYDRWQKTLKGDLKANETIAGLEANDYDVATLHIPYGFGWDARRIEKLVYQTDLGMNSTFNPKNKERRLHRHPAFFGTIKECLEDCCENCPEPIDDDERKLQKDEAEKYIRGRIKFIEENPGRQSISGSFNPIDVGEWSEQVYLKPTQRLFVAIAAHDRTTVQNLIKDGIDLNQRDHVGRTSLHVAILSKAVDIARDLIESGARITARLVDGRTPSHLASQYDQLPVLKKLFEKNALNVAEEEVKNPKKEEDAAIPQLPPDSEKPSSEDDWSSHSDEDIEMVDAEDDAEDGGEVDDDDEDGDDGGEDDDNDEQNSENSDKDESDDDDGDDDDGQSANDDEAHSKAECNPPTGDIPEEDDLPDIIDFNLLDWDFGFSALSYAVVFASVPLIQALIGAGADVKTPTKEQPYHPSAPLHPLTLTILREDEEDACRIAECLIAAGATSTTANDEMWTIFHLVVSSGKARLLATILRCDEHAVTMVNFPAFTGDGVVFPVVTAIEKQNYASLAVLFSNDAKLVFDESDITRAQEAASSSSRIANSDVKNYTEMAYQTLETAIHDEDDVVQLLLALGAPLNVALKSSLGKYTESQDRRTIIDWVEYALSQVTKEVQRLERSMVTSRMDVDQKLRKNSFKAFFKNWQKSQVDALEKQREEKRAKRDIHQKLEAFKDAKTYLEEVQRLLKARGAKSWNDIYPDIVSTASPTFRGDYEDEDDEDEKKSEESSYLYITTEYSRQFVPQHMIREYDELYEACYAGDDAKIQKLCLPAEGAGDKDKKRLLNISVFIIDKTMGYYNKAGFTPLFAAVVAGKWATAKLILSIAYAQYHPKDPKEKTFKTSDLKFDGDDDDDDDEGSDTDSDMTAEKKEVTFIDIATRSSSVRSQINPHVLLKTSFGYGKEEKRKTHDLLTKAVIDDDLAAFIHMANLYKSLPQPLEMSEEVLSTIISYDRPEILDEFIARTGLGIDIHVAQKDIGDTPGPAAVNDKNRVYLGLNVHGKKRADLATKNDPDAQFPSGTFIPLVWRAAKESAKGIISYLAFQRPLGAYRRYATSHTDERAMWLGRVADLEERLPIWLGWTTDALGQNPLVAAILGKNVETLQWLFEKAPNQLMEDALRQRIKLVGYNPLILAVCQGSEADKAKKIVDFLLAKSNSPAERDYLKGWNIYHWICHKNFVGLLEHLLKVLPRDVNETLLLQQSKNRFNTPLHLAVHAGAKAIVKLIIDYSTESVLLRDVNGSTALHTAVRSGFPEITKILLGVVGAETLQMEDGVGSTILEIASLPELNDRLQALFQELYENPGELPPNDVDFDTGCRRYNKTLTDELSKEIPKLRAIIEELLPAERKKRRTKVIWELNTFATMVESRVKEAKAAAEATALANQADDDEENVPTTDTADHHKTLLMVREAVEENPRSLKRQLINVTDVQISVSADLENAQKAKDEEEREHHDGLDEENEDNDARKLKKSMLGNFVDTEPDNI